MFVAEAEAVDVESFTWLVFNRTTPYKSQPQQYHPKHTLVLSKGDVYGVLRTRKKVYQLVKADAQHVLYRNIVPSVHDKLFKDSLPYRGKIDQQSVEEGFQRARRVSTTQNESKKSVRTSPFFVPEGRVDETEELDYSNYQWRKLLGTTKLESKKQGVVKKILKKDELVGLRYVSPSHGGYVIYDSNHRVHVSTEQYNELAANSKVLPLSQQMNGKADIANTRRPSKTEKPTSKLLADASKRRAQTKKERPPVIEETIKSKYDLTDVDPIDFFKSKRTTTNAVERTNRVMKNIMDAPELPAWEGDDAEELFEDDPEQEEEGEEEFDSEEQDDEPDEIEDDAPEDGEDGEDGEEEDDEETGPLADALSAGTMFVANDREFAIIQSEEMERNEHLVEYIAHETDADSEELYRFRLPSNYTLKQFLDKGYEILDNRLDDDELNQLQLLLEDAKFKPLPIVK